MILLEQCKMR